jgi:poly(3-hydroxybutyrate) depolymerase
MASLRADPRAVVAFRAGLLALAVALVLGGCKSESTKLPALGADLAATSVSGLSSGAYMAGQFQIAHSRIVVGAGLVAGGPFGCAESVFADQMPGPGTAFLNLSKAINGCMLDAMRAWGVPDVQRLAERARKLAQKDRIDALETLARGRVYLFAGTQDRTVVPSIVRAAAELYAALDVAPAHIKLVADIAAGHAFVTAGKGIACGRTADPYITDCGYDQAGELLAHIYGALQPRAAETAGEYIAFQQREFFGDLADHGLGEAGVLYVPRACRPPGGCRVHVVFHGCNQHRAKLGDTFAKDTGFANWAERNRLIVLFPQTDVSPVNPQACWDWWGYTGRDYLTRKGPQIVAVRRMLDRLASQP